MLKRTKGVALIILLVVTGLAGTISTTLTKKERKFAASHLKETKSALVKSVKGLSEAQLNFKPSADKWSVKECVQHIAISEGGLWGMLEGAMNQPANPEKRADIKFTDESIVKMVSDRSSKFKAPEQIWPDKAKWKTWDETLEAFKTQRANIIQYIKSTTGDMRNHVVQTPIGVMDAYQMLLFISAHSNRHTQQLNEVISHPDFPKQ